MKAVIQRVLEASVSVDGGSVGKIKNGLCIFLGVAAGDTEDDARILCDKIVKMRIFSDINGKMNLSLSDIEGEMLVISNFTLNADYRHGNRPDYLNSAPPDEANRLYEYFIKLAREKVRRVENGKFGAHMHVNIVNDGPVTICADSEVLRK